MLKFAKYSLAASLAAYAFMAQPTNAVAEATVAEPDSAVIVTVDRAKVFRMSSPAKTVIIGNPSIADATVEDDVTLVLTGRSFGVTNLIVLDREVNSMTEFKQIVGRGTRVHEDTNKLYFTLIDFRGATTHFADPDFDGDPAQIYEPGSDEIYVFF